MEVLVHWKCAYLWLICVKRVLILLLVHNVQENYYNVKFIWNLLNMDSLTFQFSADLKIYNIMCGIQNHSSTHPWCYCPAKKIKNLFSEENLRTYQSLLDDLEKSIHSVIHDPIFGCKDVNDPVLFLLIPPELHLFIGITNYLYKKFKAIHSIIANTWIKQCAIKQNANFGNDFNGNQCKKLLQNIEKLKFIASNKANKSLDLFIEAFERFKQVVHACFGRELDYQFESVIERFKDTCRKLEMDETPKLHILFTHVI